MTDRYDRRARDDRRGADRPRSGAMRSSRETRPPEPQIDDEVTPQDLDPDVRRDLKTLDRVNADLVARHLVMTSRLLDDDPRRALEHARAARRRAGRIAVVRETGGIAAYNAQEWTEALSELRAARRMSGSVTLLPLMADCERGLGHPARAIDIARSDEARALTGDEATEMKIVESGARIDLGEPDKAVVTLQTADLDPARTGTGPARLFYAYATALHAAGRSDDAITWYMNAASADEDDVTDAELRLVELGDPQAYQAMMQGADEETASHGETGSRDETGRVTADGSDVPSHSETAAGPAPESSLGASYDAIFFDLDGTLYAGRRVISGAPQAVAGADVPVYFVTNNASRRAPEVAEHLTDLGFTAVADQVVTSAQSAARLLAEHVEPGSRALVVGTEGLVQEIREVGVGTTRSADDRPAAVVQGHSTETGWAQLSEAVLAVRAGAIWIACNVDATLPSERGLMAGNGAMVAAVAHATGRKPLVAGKPAPPLLQDTIERSGARRPLVVGDRLDTDIAGANAVGVDSLLVLTGVSTLGDAMIAETAQRPTHVAATLAALREPAEVSRVSGDDRWHIEVSDDEMTITFVGADEIEQAVGALPAAMLDAAWRGDAELASPPRLTSADDDTVAALRRLGVDADSVSRR